MVPIYIRDLIYNFLKQDLAQRGDVETVILTGSFAAGKATEHSDIDLCYIGSFSGFQRESTAYQGREFQLMIGPWSWYEYVVSEYERKGSNVGTITVMIANGICFVGDTDKWKSLQKLANSFYNEGPKPASNEEIRKTRLRITELWEDFCDAETELNRQWLAMEILKKCIETHFIFRNWWAVKSKYQMDELKVRDPFMANLLTGCIQSLGSKEELHRICTYVLKPVGGWINSSHKDNMF